MNTMPITRTRPLVLNVDDDAANRDLKTRSLLMDDMEVIEADNGATALAMIAERQPLLVLLDLDLPDAGSQDLCRWIKANCPDTMVIQISATAAMDQVIGLETGSDCYLTTPVTPLELIAVSRTMLRLRHVESEARDASERCRMAVESAVAERTHDLAEANDRLRAEATEREKAGEQIRQLQKMEALGQLTSGIAHDFNNLLTAILGGLEVTRRRIEDERSLRLIDSSISAAQRGAKLIKQLMAFARMQNLQVEYLALNGLVDDMRELLERSVGATVRFEYDLAPDIWPVMADANQVQTAMLNLAVNARDAMEGGGILRITTRNIRVAAPETDLEAGAYASLSMQDNGTGMPPEVRERLFEPFFTTKDVGKGTGLGLAQLYGFVRQSGGGVRVHSVAGEGTTITILLPRSSETETRRDPA